MTETLFRFDQGPSVAQLRQYAGSSAAGSLRALFAGDTERFTRFSCQADGLVLDYSKQRIDTTILASLLDLADEAGLRQGIDAMLSGEPVNVTEGRAALHCAARLFEPTPASARAEISCTLDHLHAFVREIHEGKRQGATGMPLRHVVHIGIGGSDLGPRLLHEAFSPSLPQQLELSFAANIDEAELAAILNKAKPEETLFILASKSFTTAETLSNASIARHWLITRLGDRADLSCHFAAISNNVAAAEAFGIRQDAVFPLPEWIGGRFSVWSAIGLPLMLAYGAGAFDDFLRGGRCMDAHFADAPFSQNLPVLMALLGIWNTTFLEMEGLVVLPYSHRLRSLPAYLQQLEMESNGKSVDRDGHPVRWHTAPFLFGGPGTVGQHAYHQLFYQGTRKLALDFLIPVEQPSSHASRSLMGNALAQSAALMLGRSLDEACSELLARGLPDSEVARLAPHLVCPGNQVSTTLLMPSVTPFTLGQLVALYEHKVFVQGWIWGINSFDQYGVELGKEMARNIEDGSGAEKNSSTAGLLMMIETMLAATGQRN